MSTWLIGRVGTAVTVWNLGDPGGQLDDLLNRARVQLGFPPAGDQVHTLQLSFGDPHDSLLAVAAVGGDLFKVDPVAVQNWVTAAAGATRQAQITAAAAAYNALDAAGRALVVSSAPPPVSLPVG